MTRIFTCDKCGCELKDNFSTFTLGKAYDLCQLCNDEIHQEVIPKAQAIYDAMLISWMEAAFKALKEMVSFCGMDDECEHVKMAKSVLNAINKQEADK